MRNSVAVPCRCNGLTELNGEGADGYAHHHLNKIGADPSGWVTYLVCPQTGRRFVLDYPQGEYHGGGPARLRATEAAPA